LRAAVSTLQSLQIARTFAKQRDQNGQVTTCFGLLHRMMAMLAGLAVALLALCATAHASDLSEYIAGHEGYRQCVYLDTNKIRTNCFGLNLEQKGPTAKALVEAEGGNWTAIRYGPVCDYKCNANRCDKKDRECSTASSTRDGCLTYEGCLNIFAQQLLTFEREMLP
jgi:heme A synthase